MSVKETDFTSREVNILSEDIIIEVDIVIR